MKEKTAKELLRRYGHQLLIAFVRIVFPTERHSPIGDIDDPVVGDSHAMRIAGQILENVLRSSKWSFGINHPILTKQRPQESLESPCFSQWFQTAWKHECVLIESPPLAGNQHELERDKTRTEWHRILCWTKLADWAGTQQKGAYVKIEGELRYRDYTPAEADRSVRVAEIHANSILALDRSDRQPVFIPESEPADESLD